MKPARHDGSPNSTRTVQGEQIHSAGEVGIFWFFKGKILSDSVPLALGDEYGDFINGSSDHCTFWANIRRKVPGSDQYEYDQVPRGRVVYNKKIDRFFVYGSEDLVSDEQRKAVVVSTFRLPAAKTTFKSDEHYGSIPGMVADED